jgi:uncharacterized phiE125 gp8 family phage protein
MLTLVTGPAETPVSVAEIKSHLRISNTASDTLLATLLQAAVDEIDGPDGYLRRAIVTQTWDLKGWQWEYMPGWHNSYTGRRIHLPCPPLQSISYVKYFDVDNVEQTVDAGEYRTVITTGGTGFLEFVETYTLPQVYERADAVRVGFVAGYGAASDVPAPIKAALHILTAELYAQRGDMDNGPGVNREIMDRLLGRYRWMDAA